MPLFAAVVGVGLTRLAAASRRRARLAGLVVGLLAIGATANLLLADFHSTTVWPYDADTRAMLADLHRDVVARHLEPPVELGIDWRFEPTVNFYQRTTPLDWLAPVGREGLKAGYRYYYVHPGNLDLVDAPEVEVLRTYPWTGNQLARGVP